MRSAFLVLSILGCYTCAAAFRDEWKSGKAYPSLLIASLAWAVGIFAALFFWRD